MTYFETPESPDPGRFTDEEATRRPDPREQADGSPQTEPNTTEAGSEAIERER
jgi:hypothetical protein